MKKLNFTVVHFLLIGMLAYSITSCQSARHGDVQASIVDRPDTTQSNSHYISNRPPLLPSALIKLPIGAIEPEGWLKEYLLRQKNGLTGNLGKISAWLQIEDNAWLDANGHGEWGWEEVPYWLKGFANIGYILDDQEMIDEAKIWIEGTIKSQQPNGFFGPDFAWISYISEAERTEAARERETKVRDYWANMIMLYCLQSYYEYSNDERVIKLMTNYFKYQLTVPDSLFLSETKYWQRIRGGDNLHSVMWLYNRTGDAFLLDLAEKIHRNTAPWKSRGHELSAIGNHKSIREGMEWPSWYGNLIDWHNVNIAQAFREPAQYYLLSHDKSDLQATYDNFDIVRRHFGQVPGGMFGADENARPGYDDPRQGIETCGMVEQMNSDEHLLRITGDILWADHAEEVAFNSYPAAVMEDFKALRYFTSPNMVQNDSKNHHPGIDNNGPFLMMNPFSSRCCQHNHAQGWPYYAENLWMASPDNGLASVLYVANVVTATVGDGTEVQIEETTRYPFEEEVHFKLATEQAVNFPWYLRIPAWCNEATVWVNGEKTDINPIAGKYVCLRRNWTSGDEVTLKLPMSLSVKTWQDNHQSASVDYGPLTFSLKIEEHYEKVESDKTAIGDSKWQKDADTRLWPSYEIYAGSPWNYGLMVDKELPEKSFEIHKKPWPVDNFPFSATATPIEIRAKGKRIPAWTMDEHGLAGELKDSPVKTQEPEEQLTLIPMGAARLRISAFPVIGEGSSAVEW
ncbi:MAG: hypothetical protein HC819_04505 [Cyclobacteriaceae bacterium]|nr:hypothetical protein [Cyclobacteriaceae bacterium]